MKIERHKASDYAARFLATINQRFAAENTFDTAGYSEFTIESETLAYIFKLQPHGFIIVAAFDQVSPVIGFSLEDDFPEGENLLASPVYALLKNKSLSHKYSFELNNHSNFKSSVSDTVYGPYVLTLWGQVNCHNNQGQLVNVTNYYTPNHYAVGCVALSLSTLLHYYNWPPVGEGYHQYFDAWGSSTGWYEANFGETYYKWNLMLDKYNNQASTDAQREAAGELAFHTAVALEMNFEYNGSSANVNEIPGASSDYFRTYSFYKEESSSVFWPRLDKNIMEANPVILSVENSSGSGHSVVCDGLWIDEDEERFYHLNMGWWGSGNGWFTIQGNFNASGYNTINGGVLDFIPKPYLSNALIAPDTNMFHLQWQYSHTIDPDAFEIQHKINSGSWVTISDTYQDTSILIVIENIADDHFYRVRAKVNDEWYPSSWSNTVQLQIMTVIDDGELPVTRSVFPNPFNNYFTIYTNLNSQDELLVRIFNSSGKLYYQSDKNIDNEQITVQSENWEKGLYLAEIKSGEIFKVIKIVKN
jgi:hypothetical protein